jgi:hypothetical protein
MEVSLKSKSLIYSRGINKHLDWLIFNWDSKEVSAEIPEDRQWWEFWKINQEEKKNLLVIGRYLLEGLEDFIDLAIAESDDEILEYKMTILSSMSTLYDRVIKDANIPWWIKPFSSYLKDIVINVIISLLFDFLIKKI